MKFEWNYDRTWIVDLSKMRKFNYEKSEEYPYGWSVIGWFSDTETVILKRVRNEEEAISALQQFKDRLDK